MTSKLNQRAASILAGFGIGVLVILIVLLWMLVGHGHGGAGRKPDNVPKYTSPARMNVSQAEEDRESSSADGSVAGSSSGSIPGHRSHVEGYGHNVNTELVRPLKISPPPLHQQDIFYEQIYNQRLADNDTTPERPTIRHHSGHFRHRQAEVWDPHPEYEVPAFGVLLHLVLAHDDSFVPPTLKVTHVWTNLTLKVQPEVQTAGCFYTGIVQGEEDSKVAVSLCGGMTGYIRSRSGNYYIEPAEPYHNATVPSILHKIHKVQEQQEAAIHVTDKTCDTATSDADWPRAAFDDIVTSDHQHHHHVNKRETSTKNFIGPPYRLNGHSVSNREYFVETLVVVDRKMAEYHKTDENLIHYVLTLMSYVSLLYKDATIGNPISISVVDIMIVRDRDFVTRRRPLKENNDNFDGVNGEEMLKNFCIFQNEVIVNSSSTYRHDTALLLTRETICRNTAVQSCDTQGLAEVGTMCNPSSSCAIVKDKGLSTSYTIAHELGHVLSMPHDDDHKCRHFLADGQAGVKQIMNKVMLNKSKPWLWSACSKYFVTEYLDSSKSHCLFNEPGRDLATNMTHRLPGEIFDNNTQCELVYGNGSKICSFMPACGLLWCAPEHGEHQGCKTLSTPWADGTYCDPGHWCYRGKCVMSDRDLLQPIVGGWGPWRRWGACSRPCGGGIQKSERACDAPRPANGGPYCMGPSVRYMSCNTDQCRQPQFLDFREEQCAAFNGNRRGLPGLTSAVKWVPKYGGTDHMCKLYCRVHQSNAYYLLSEKVVDGTKCGLNTFDICVNGICRRGGCDNRLDSNLTLDECGICGGDNSRCEEISGTYNVPKPVYGYNKVTRIPRGSSSIDIRQHGYRGTNNDSNYLALVDSETGAYILNGDFTVSTFGKVIMYGGVPIEYTGSKLVVERVNSTASMQLQKDLIVEYLSVGHLLPPNISYSYKITRDSAPQYSWQLYDGQWSPCSSICSGSRHIIPRCVQIATGAIVSDEYCETLDLDGARSTQDCNMHCKLSWKVTARQQCSAHCGKGVREVQHQCVKIDDLTTTMTTTVDVKTHHHLLDPPNVDLAQSVPVNENHCSQMSRPTAYEPCEGPCDATRWEYDEWSVCTKSCDGGFQTRRAKCMDTANNMLEDVACAGKEKRMEQSCNTGKCPTWTLGDWSPCSVTCGRGIRKKPLYCQLGGRILNADACNNQNVPLSEEVCMLKRCFSWDTAEWEPCSVTCGTGIQKRRLACISVDDRTVNVAHCEDMLRPNSTRVCRMDPDCPDIEDNSIIPSTFDLYGGFKWQWGPWGECSQSCNGGTRSRNVACQNGTGAQHEMMCDPAVRPKHGDQCNMAPCPVWNHDDWSECNDNCKRHRRVLCQGHNGALVPDDLCHIAKRPINETKCLDRRCVQHPHPHLHLHHHRYKWKMGSWGECSKTCSADTKTRPLFCTDLLANANVVNKRYCNHLRRPRTQRPCISAECEYVWIEGPWTRCTRSCNKGAKYRNVTCHHRRLLATKQRGVDPTPVEGIRCKAERKPHDQEACVVRYCNEMYTWNTAIWEQCSHDCGFKGRQFRKLRCLNQNRKRVSKRLCAKSLKPPRKQKCNQHKCVYKSCADVQRQLQTHQNHEYELTLQQDRILRVYCDAMDTGTPREYVSLPNDGRDNYAEVYDKRLLDADTCPGGGGRNEQCACMAADSGRTGLTMFSKVRLNITVMGTLNLIADDYTFARQSKGVQVPYGTAGDCYSRVKNCPQGRFSINLTGTGLKLKSEVRWVSSGPGASHTVHRQDDTKVNGKCGGYCGNCHPDYSSGLAVELE